MTKKNNKVVSMSTATWQQRAATDGFVNPMNDPDWPSGVDIVDYGWHSPSTFEMHQPQQQCRQAGLDHDHLRDHKSWMESRVEDLGNRSALREPTFHTVDPIKNVKNTEQGNHRHTAAIELGVPKVPSFEIKYSPRTDGRDPRKELNEWHNNKNAPSKPHGEMEAIRHLEDLHQRGEFASDLKIKDAKKQEAAIRKRANDELRKNYGRYTAQKRGGWITKWRNGAKPKQMRSWSNGEVWDFGQKNNHLSGKPTNGSVYYDPLSLLLQTVTQTHTSWSAIGLLSEKVKDIYGSLRDQGTSLTKIRKHLGSLDVEVMSYVDSTKLSSISNLSELNARRDVLLVSLAEYNIQGMVPFTFTKVMFVPQCLQPAEALAPIVYTWDSVNQKFV